MKEPTPFERLTRLARAIIAVPKEEADRQARAFDKKSKARRTKRKSAKA